MVSQAVQLQALDMNPENGEIIEKQRKLFTTLKLLPTKNWYGMFMQQLIMKMLRVSFVIVAAPTALQFITRQSSERLIAERLAPKTSIVPIEPESDFYPVREEHQDFYKKRSFKYNFIVLAVGVIAGLMP